SGPRSFSQPPLCVVAEADSLRCLRAGTDAGGAGSRSGIDSGGTSTATRAPATRLATYSAAHDSATRGVATECSGRNVDRRDFAGHEPPAGNCEVASAPGDDEPAQLAGRRTAVICIHLSDEELTAAATGERSPRTAGHLEICPQCWEQMSVYRERLTSLKQ